MSEEVKFDHKVDIKEHIDLLKKAIKNGQTFRVYSLDINHLYDKSVHFEIILRSNRYGNTKTFSTFLSPEVYEKTIKPLVEKLERTDILNKRFPDDESKRIKIPMISEKYLDAVVEEDLSKFFDDL